MKTRTTHTTHAVSRRMGFLGAMFMLVVMGSAAAFSQPTAPVPASPLEGQLNVTTGPTLGWSAAAGSGTVTYHLQVSLSSLFGSTVYDNATLTGLTQSISGLSNGTIYHWRVSATDDGGAGPYSTGQSFSTNPTPINLGTAGDFRIFANTGITGGAGSSIIGDIGVSAAAETITGFSQTLSSGGTFSTSAFVTGKIYAFDYADPTPTKMTTAAADMGTAYTNAANRTPIPVGTFLNAGVGEIGNLVLGPGLYKWTTDVNISNDLTLTGNATDVWIFQIAGTLNMADAKQIILAGGALASNIFWQAAGQVTLIGTSAMKGTILSKTGIAFGANGTLDGRALAQANVTLISTTALPVELVSFTGSANRLNAELRWSTATEAHNYGFEIERRETGAWRKAGFVAGAGTSNSPRDYAYTDRDLANGRYTYRIKQIDNDGAFAYFGSVEVTMNGTSTAFSLSQNNPNPFNPSTQIRYSLEKPSQVSLKVYDVLGHEVAVLVNSPQEAGSYAVQFNANSGRLNLASGVYFYRLEAGSFTSMKKLILVK